MLGPCQAKCLSMLFTTSCHTDRKVTCACAWPLPSKMPFHAFHNILSHRQESDLCLAPAKQNAFPCFHNILSHRQESDLCLAPAKQNAFPCFSQHLVTRQESDLCWPLPSKMPFHAGKVTCAWPLPSKMPRKVLVLGKMPFHAFHNILSHRQESDLCLAPAKQNAFPCFSQHLVTQTGK